MRCVEQLVRDGHTLVGCKCGRVHFDSVLGIVNPAGWTVRGLVTIYGSAVAVAAIVVAMIVWIAGTEPL